MFWQSITVRTTQLAADLKSYLVKILTGREQEALGSYSKPKLMSPKRRIYCQAFLWTLRHFITGTPASMMSETDVTQKDLANNRKLIQADSLSCATGVL